MRLSISPTRPPALLALVLTAALLTACAPRKPQPPAVRPFAAYSEDGTYLPPAVGPGLVADPESPIPDVPLPIGFTPVPARSSTTATPGQARQVHHVYQGRATVDEVGKFYDQILSQYRWKPLGKRDLPHGMVQQGFVKGPEQLTITTSQKPGIIAQSIATVVVDITPRGSSGSSR